MCAMPSMHCWKGKSLRRSRRRPPVALFVTSKAEPQNRNKGLRYLRISSHLHLSWLATKEPAGARFVRKGHHQNDFAIDPTPDLLLDDSDCRVRSAERDERG